MVAEINKRVVAVKLLSEEKTKNGFILIREGDTGKFNWIKKRDILPFWSLPIIL